MSLVLNTNIDSLMAQNSLTTSGNSLSTALEQLSSGLRINTAADDAAGYAIVQGMTSQIGGLNQAAQNANDGVSLTQTASGALQEVTSDLQSMRDLAVESLNATNSTQDRADLDTQFQQLKADINQVAATANFNGVNLLDGSFEGATFQIGANAGQTITVGSVASASSANLGTMYASALTGGGVAGVYDAGVANANIANGDTATLSVTVNGTAYTTGAISLTGNAATDLKSEAAAVNQAISPDTGIVATVNAAGTAIQLSSTLATPTATNVVAFAVTAATGTLGTVFAGVGGAAAALTDLGVDSSDTVANTGVATTLSTSTVQSVDASNLALGQINSALQQIATTSAQLGAYQNRFTAAIAGINTDSTNLSSARSGIEDTDYASATTQLSQAQILQQASTAMVAQANTIPQNVLTLLQKLP
jgi:flagellin